LVLALNRALGIVVDEKRVDTWFEREWPELERNLAAIPAAGRAAAPSRPEREMVAEVLELVRAGTVNSANVTEALAVLTAGVREVLERVAGPRVPLSAFSGIGAPTTFGGIGGAVGSGLGRGLGALADMSAFVATEETEEEKAKRARLIAEITKLMEGEGKKGETKKADDESK
jgi:hypothetical protein